MDENPIETHNFHLRMNCMTHEFVEGGFLFWRYIFCRKCGTYRPITQINKLTTKK